MICSKNQKKVSTHVILVLIVKNRHAFQSIPVIIIKQAAPLASARRAALQLAFRLLQEQRDDSELRQALDEAAHGQLRAFAVERGKPGNAICQRVEQRLYLLRYRDDC